MRTERTFWQELSASPAVSTEKKTASAHTTSDGSSCRNAGRAPRESLRATEPAVRQTCQARETSPAGTERTVFSSSQHLPAPSTGIDPLSSLGVNWRPASVCGACGWLDECGGRRRCHRRIRICSNLFQFQSISLRLISFKIL